MMPQSLTRLYAHLIFSTKNRKRFLNDEIQLRVNGYLATVVRNLDSQFVVVGGAADHVHILFDIGKLHAPVKFVEQVKRESSKFVKTLGTEFQNFYWQRGYGMFSLAQRTAQRWKRTFETRNNIIVKRRSGGVSNAPGTKRH